MMGRVGGSDGGGVVPLEIRFKTIHIPFQVLLNSASCLKIT